MDPRLAQIHQQLATFLDKLNWKTLFHFKVKSSTIWQFHRKGRTSSILKKSSYSLRTAMTGGRQYFSIFRKEKRLRFIGFNFLQLHDPHSFLITMMDFLDRHGFKNSIIYQLIISYLANDERE